MRRPSVLLADDHQIVLAAFTRLLESTCDVVGTVTDGQAVVKAAGELKPDLVLLDVGLPHLNGLDACLRIRQQVRRTRVIVLTMDEDPEVAAEAMRRGASGYLLKSSPPAELFDAIREVFDGRTYISPRIASEPAGVFVSRARTTGGGGLTLREREVLQLLAEGKSMKAAATLLGVTPRTIAFHKYTMMNRLGLKTGAALIQHAVAIGLVTARSST